jgi:hypothetical protein
MTPLLLTALKELLEQAFSEVVYRDPAEKDDSLTTSYTQPRIFIGALPPKRATAAQKEDFPFVVVRAVSGTVPEDGSTIEVRLICGIYSAGEPEYGVNDIQNMVDRILRVLAANRLLDRRFALELPITWAAGDDNEANQPHPYYVSIIKTNWTAPAAQRLDNSEAGTFFGESY